MLVEAESGDECGVEVALATTRSGLRRWPREAGPSVGASPWRLVWRQQEVAGSCRRRWDSADSRRLS